METFEKQKIENNTHFNPFIQKVAKLQSQNLTKPLRLEIVRNH